MKRLLYLLTALILVLSVYSRVLADTINDGLIAYFPFDGNANDASRYGNNGTVYGATLTTDRFGNANSAYGFDGINDYIDCGYSPVLSPSNALTISAWIQRQGNIGGDGSLDFIVSRMDTDTTRAYYLGFWYDMLQMEVAKAGTLSYRFYMNSNTTITDTNWHYVAGVFDGSKMDLYIDGVNVGSQSTGNVDSINQNTSSLVIGFDRNAPDGDYFSGSIDDVRLYGRALSATEIAELANATPVPEPSTMLLVGTGLVGLAGLRRKFKRRLQRQ